ncbi:MAG: hypothetical protein P8N11_07065 [Gammaproteobacteria bacterium]|jgi:hypothetical protein|nr:hypothetical protein [Gammaproteobacteria bacterium]
MKPYFALFSFSIGLFAASLLLQNTSAQDTESDERLIIDDGWQAVQENCTECHSTLLITQNSGSKTVWESRIRWMQETQGLQQLEESLEESILNYLAQNYGQKESSRRASLAVTLMPDNPYESID